MSGNEQVEMDKMAMAIQHAIHLLRWVNPVTEIQFLGVHLSIDILLPLAAELALKGLKQKETTPDGFIQTHNLPVLFEDVSQSAQIRIDRKFRWYLSHDDETKDKTLDLWQFLKEHKDDFVGWRYLEEDKVESLAPTYEEFQYAICAILDEVYESDGVVRMSLTPN